MKITKVQQMNNIQGGGATGILTPGWWQYKQKNYFGKQFDIIY